MSTDLLGEHFDIHGGGLDLRFPHHENELAQSRAAGFEYANFWVHNGLVNSNGTKMSKSLGNFVSADDLFEQDPRGLAIRYYLLTAQYRANLEYHDGVLAEAKSNIRGIESFVKRALSLIAPALESPSAFLQNEFDFDLLPADFVAAMNDDLNVPAALAVLHEAIRAGNIAVDAADINVATEQLGATIMMCKVLNVYPFDVNASGAAVWPAAEASAELKSKIEQLVADRLAAKAAKDFARADAIRDELTNLGVTLEDSADKTNWSVN
jgi:cysteinyl-tRNA synthetase